MGPSPKRRKLLIDGLELSWLEWGCAQLHLPSLVCLHGLIATGDSFAAVVENLPPGIHVLALDLPGNGASGVRSDLDASFRGLASLVRGFLASVGVNRPVLLGHSHGGAIALQVAVAYPDLVRGLVLFAPAHPFSGHETKVVRFYLAPLGRVAAHLVPFLPAALQRRGLEQMLGSGNRIERTRFEPYRRNLRTRTVAHVLRLLATWEQDMQQLGAELRDTRPALPVLLLWGALDAVVPANTAATLQGCLRHAELRILHGIGHLPNEEAPGLCARLLVEWLARFSETQPRKEA